MNLTDLKAKPIPELLNIAQEMGLENLGRSRKQEIIASVLRKHAKAAKTFTATARSKSFKTALAFSVRLIRPTSLVLTIYMCHPARFGGSTCEPVTLSPEK